MENILSRKKTLIFFVNVDNKRGVTIVIVLKSDTKLIYCSLWDIFLLLILKRDGVNIKTF